MPIISSPAIPANPNPKVRAALKYIDAVSRRDWTTVDALRTADYQQTLHPECVNHLSKDITGGHDLLTLYWEILPLMETFEIVVHEILEAPTDKVIIHCSGDAQATFGHRYKNEYIFICDVSKQADGSYKLRRMKEFSDSFAAKDCIEAAKKTTAIPLFGRDQAAYEKAVQSLNAKL